MIITAAEDTDIIEIQSPRYGLFIFKVISNWCKQKYLFCFYGLMIVMKPFVLGFYGGSDTGKTTLIVDIISRLTKEGYKVASVKISNKKVSIDSEGKDTWKHSSAGSNLVVFSTDIETDFLLNQKMSNTELIDCINHFGKYDIILIEGANDKSIPKIRIGKIKERKNTFLNYEGDFEKLVEYIKKEIDRRY